MISPSSIHYKLTQQGDFIFRVCFTDQFQSRVLANFALTHLHAKKIAILEDVKSDYSRDTAKLFSEIFKQAGGQIVITQSYGAGDIDFKSQLTAIRAFSPDLILVPGYYTEVALIARQKKELGMTVHLLGGDGWDSPKLKEIAGDALDGSYFVSHFLQDNPSPQVRKFIQNYQSAFGGDSPDGQVALGYDAALLLSEALRRAKSTSSEDLRNSIASIQNFSGVTGNISIGPDRNAVKAAIIYKLVNGGNLALMTLMNP